MAFSAPAQNTTAITHTEFRDLLFSEASVICLIVKNNSIDGLILAAYQFVFDNGNAVLLQHQHRETPGLAVGEACLYQCIGGRTQITPAQPVGAESIAELHAAKQEFLPRMFAN